MNPVRKGKPAECKNLIGLKDKTAMNGKPTAYLCQGGNCKRPVQDIAELTDLLKGENG